MPLCLGFQDALLCTAAIRAFTNSKGMASCRNWGLSGKRSGKLGRPALLPCCHQTCSASMLNPVLLKRMHNTSVCCSRGCLAIDFLISVRVTCHVQVNEAAGILVPRVLKALADSLSCSLHQLIVCPLLQGYITAGTAFWPSPCLL